MSAVHPEVQDLLTPVLEGPLAPFGERALASIQRDEDFIAAEDRLDRDQVSRDSSPRGRGLRQLDLLHEAIALPLKLELALCEQLAQLAPDFGIEAIDVETESVDGRADIATDHLLAPQRRKAIAEFLDIWLSLWEVTRNAVGGQDEG